MGYGADTTNVDFFLPAEHIRTLVQKHMEDTGAELEMEILDDPEQRKHYVRDIFRDAGWQVEFDRGSQDIVDIRHHGSFWSEGTDRLFTLLAPFVKLGSTVEMLGEDDTRWRYTFTGGTFVEEYAIGPFYSLLDLVKELMNSYGSETTLEEIFMAEELKGLMDGTVTVGVTAECPSS